MWTQFSALVSITLMRHDFSQLRFHSISCLRSTELEVWSVSDSSPCLIISREINKIEGSLKIMEITKKLYYKIFSSTIEKLKMQMWKELAHGHTGLKSRTIWKLPNPSQELATTQHGSSKRGLAKWPSHTSCCASRNNPVRVYVHVHAYMPMQKKDLRKKRHRGFKKTFMVQKQASLQG